MYEIYVENRIFFKIFQKRIRLISIHRRSTLIDRESVVGVLLSLHKDSQQWFDCPIELKCNHINILNN